MNLALYEHGEIHRDESPRGEPGDLARWRLTAPLYDRLKRHDLGRAKKDRVFVWYDGYAKATQWVGVVQIPGLTVEILPKIDGVETSDGEDAATACIRRNLLYMLTTAGHLPARERDLADLASCRSPLLDVIVRLFSARLRDELLKGPDRSYLAREENLHRFKGRLVVARHVAANAAHKERFLCAYDEFSEDTALARVLKAACALLHRTTRSAATQEALRHCLMLLDDVADEPAPLPLLERVHITRQNERFRDLFTFASLVLRGRSPEPRAGGERTFSLLFDMNALFEAFLTKFLQRHVVPELPNGALRVQGKGDPRYLMLRESRVAPAHVLKMKPDLLITWSGGMVVVDTKWKVVWSDEERRERVARDDLYQMFAYGHRYQSIRSVLLYPHSSGIADAAAPTRYAFCAGDGNERDGSGRHLDIAFVDLRHDLRTGRDRLVGELKRIIEPQKSGWLVGSDWG